MSSNFDKTRIRINVTTADIQSGRRNKPTSCPIALATKRAVGRKRGVWVDGLWLDVGLHTFELPLKAREFVLKFDNKDRVRPFGFTVRPRNDF